MGALVETICRFAQLVHELPGIEELEVNPLLVTGAGALAVDIRGRLAEPEHEGPERSRPLEVDLLLHKPAASHPIAGCSLGTVVGPAPDPAQAASSKVSAQPTYSVPLFTASSIVD